MEPLGTITKYYPFLEREIQSTLDSLMKESSNYYDLVCRLAEHVLDNDVHQHLAHIAAAQAFWAHATEMLQAISKKYHGTPYIRIWGLSRGAKWMQFGADVPRRDFESEVDRVVEQSDEDWIVAEVYLSYAFHLMPSPVHETLESLDKVRVLIAENAHLRCFDALVCAIEGFVRGREPCPEEAIETLMRGLSIARESGDVLSELLAISFLAATKRNSDIIESGQLFEEAYALASDIGAPYIIAEVLNSASMVYETTGQLDLAIACQLEGLQAYSDGNDVVPHIILSRLYAKLGDGKRALEHINIAAIRKGDGAGCYFYLQRAYALILMDRLEEADDDIATAYSKLVRNDLEYDLAAYYRICGICEKAKGNLLNALDYLERAFEIDERLPRFFWGIETLFSLADVELSIELLSEHIDEAYPSGPWTTRLETQLRVHNFPGLLMRFALLKADFYQQTGQYLDARQVLSDALQLSDSDGARTFRFRIVEKINELNQLIKQPSL